MHINLLLRRNPMPFTLCVLLSALLAIIPVSAFPANKPVVLYTDITGGPITGGENNSGTYLSIFGKGFGDNLGDIKVLINGTRVASYIYLGPSKGRSDIQQLSVQPGSRVTTGKIQVFVNDRGSNTDHRFTVRKGDIYFVSLKGNNQSGRANNIKRPYRSAQFVFNKRRFGPGDTMIVRGGHWRDVGDYRAYLSIHNKSGKGKNPISILGYPGEKVFIDTQGSRGGFNFYKTRGGIVIAGFEVNSNGRDLVQLQSNTDYMRVINNELYGLKQKSGGSAAISGNGYYWKILGNHVHDIGYSKLFHGIYIDNDNGSGSKHIDIGFNHVHGIEGGRAIQLYWKQPEISHVKIHDNLLHDVDRDGIVISDNTGSEIYVYNNVIYDTGKIVGSGIRVYSSMAEVQIFNNTFYNATVSKRQAAIYVEDALRVSFYNNIVNTINEQEYFETDINPYRTTLSRNLWYGSGRAPYRDSSAIISSPSFYNVDIGDFRLKNDSAAIDAGIKPAISIYRDYSGNKRAIKTRKDREGIYDLGAYEFNSNNQ